jgi:hypothetical protein
VNLSGPAPSPSLRKMCGCVDVPEAGAAAVVFDGPREHTVLGVDSAGVGGEATALPSGRRSVRLPASVDEQVADGVDVGVEVRGGVAFAVGVDLAEALWDGAAVAVVVAREVVAIAAVCDTVGFREAVALAKPPAVCPFAPWARPNATRATVAPARIQGLYGSCAIATAYHGMMRSGASVRGWNSLGEPSSGRVRGLDAWWLR